jgi:zinc/manganese transport system substrate-binding protein
VKRRPALRLSNVLGLAGIVLAVALYPVAAGARDKVKVVASFSILGDFVRNVGGDRVEVVSLVGPEGDAHVYSPSPADGRRVAGAALMVVNGLGFDGWIDRLVQSAGSSAVPVKASEGVRPLAEPDDNGPDHAAHGHDGPDPHAWQDVANAKVYVANIRDALVAVDPAGRSVYEANAAAYLKRLDALDAEIRAAIGRIPAERRKVITSHDAFAYFERAYGLAFVAPQGVSTESEPSAADVARIIRQIRKDRIPAVFIETITDPRLMERIARETGAKLGDRVYSDALSPPDGPAGTYIDMMGHNIRAFSTALSR